IEADQKDSGQQSGADHNSYTKNDAEPVRSYLRKELATILYIEEDKITDQKDFSKIGLDSVVGVEVINQINEKYSLSLEAQVVYDYPTVEKLAEYIAAQTDRKSEIIAESDVHQLLNNEGVEVVQSSSGTNSLQSFLREKLSEILYIESHQITDKKEFSKIGLDSVVGVELINMINSEYATDLEAGCLYEYKNLELLTAYIAETIGIKPTEEKTKLPVAEELVEKVVLSTVENSEISSFLKSQLSKILFLEEARIGNRTKFAAIGLDSVVGVELVQVINETYETDIEAGCLYEYVTIEALSEYIAKEIDTATHSVPTPKAPVSKDSSVDIKADAKAIQPVPITEFVPEPPRRGKNGKVKLAELNSFGTLTKRNAKIEAVRLSEIGSGLVTKNGKKKEVQSDISAKESAKSETSSTVSGKQQQIAIVGLGGRYPGAKTLDKFWKNLRNGKNSITEIPAERWNFNDYYTKDKADRTKTRNKWGGFIADADKFSPLFFNISPREAENMDPQERLLLEVIWATIEDAGYTSENLNHSEVGVFIGNMINQYSLMTGDIRKSAAILNGSNWSLANRLSFFYDFRGPSIVINTACSSSLTAVYMACESIRRGECRHAIAGGVNLNLHPSKWIGLSNSGMIATKNQSQSMGNGEGYIPGEGVGTILLKTLEDAEADNDHIYGVITGGHINHGGRSSGFTVPNQDGQISLSKGILEKSGLTADQIHYIETASNGSQVGDPIEINGLNAAFGGGSKKIPIGTVKSNIGHCEAASGISQLTKVLLQYRNGQLVPSINSEPMNPAINLKETPFYVQNKVSAIDKQQPFRTLINSFGAGGSNTQLIVANYIKDHEKITPVAISRLIVLSAEDENQLKRVAGNLLGYLNKLHKNEQVSLTDLAYTLQTGRVDLEYRMCLQVQSVSELKDSLKNFLSGHQNDS
ncbi:MAG: beta-ketoacyl synthase N-terminal-like domain-containing protein, partial [Cyclobacteriaceae bacterium]